MNTAKIELYNTKTKALDTLKPIEAGKIKMYCCGPTVYNFQHIGNFRTFIFEDLLSRTLRAANYSVTHVMNITDVGHLTSDGDDGEDKMLVAMRRENKTSMQIAEFYTNKFFEDWDKLGLRRPDIVCKATDHIQEMISLIQRIEKAGYAYVANGNVYFDVERFKTYGELARLDLKALIAGSRIEVDQHKKNPLDFVLWFTNSKFENHELQWESPWGTGYPGWHIECSAMAIKYLGEAFDIHCGGIDHVPVHHTNEIAQSEAATGKPWVNIWMHSEFILINNDKMSKSKGGFLVLDSLLERKIHPMAYRLLCLGTHYRQQLNFSWEALEQSQNTLDRLFETVLKLKESVNQTENVKEKDKTSCEAITKEFFENFYNDLNSPRALASLWKLLKDDSISANDKLKTLYDFDQILGLGLANLEREVFEIPEEALKLLTIRQEARASKDWKKSDEIRDKLTALGFTVVDGKDGASLKKI
jgi:cysteinyl-tRNA synthetase